MLTQAFFGLVPFRQFLSFRTSPRGFCHSLLGVFTVLHRWFCPNLVGALRALPANPPSLLSLRTTVVCVWKTHRYTSSQIWTIREASIDELKNIFQFFYSVSLPIEKVLQFSVSAVSSYGAASASWRIQPSQSGSSSELQSV